MLFEPTCRAEDKGFCWVALLAHGSKHGTNVLQELVQDSLSSLQLSGLALPAVVLCLDALKQEQELLLVLQQLVPQDFQLLGIVAQSLEGVTWLCLQQVRDCGGTGWNVLQLQLLRVARPALQDLLCLGGRLVFLSQSVLAQVLVQAVEGCF